jgi:ABC-type arginine transport system ATPase subunit
MNTDVDLITIRNLLETAIKVLHVLDEQTPAEREILLLVFAVVDYVDHYRVFKVGSLKQMETWLR